MGSTRIPVTNPGNDPGRNQTPEQAPDSGAARSGAYRDAASEVHNPGGSATTRKMWTNEAYETSEGSNGPAPRDRGNRDV